MDETELENPLSTDDEDDLETLDPGVSEVQARRFQAGVELDDQRPDERHWGLRPWFKEWRQHARPGWLDPLGGDWGLMRLEDNLRKFQGDQKVMRPLLALLRRLTREDVSPAAFLRYALLSRVGFDFDWRSWERLHLGPLEAMADVVVRLRQGAPFDRPLGGSRQLGTEVVLVKYTLRPLARLPASQLEDKAQVDAYVAAWKRLKLDHPMVLFFLRRNVFPFLYAQSGRVDLVQLTGLIEALPALETAFSRRYPESLYGEAFQKQADDILIYGSDPDDALRRRRASMSDYALVQELRLYLRLLGRLLARESGLFLAGFLAKVVMEAAGTALGERLERLLDLIGPVEGVRVYEWHVRKLRGLPEARQEAYLDLVRANGGLDPEYRRAQDLFREPEARQTESAAKLVSAWLDDHPEGGAEVEAWRDDVFHGRDRGWGPFRFPLLDAAGKKVHQALLRTTIAGLGGVYSRLKSESYKDLWHQYGKTTRAPSFDARHELTLTVAAAPTPSGDPSIRQSLHLEFLADHWRRLQQAGQSPAAAAALFLQQSLVDREAADRLLTEAQNPELSAKERTKLGEQATRVRAKAETLEAVMEVFPQLTYDLQRLTALVVGAQALKQPATLLPVLLEPYLELPEVRDRLEYLKDDLRVEIITLDQLGWLQNLWDTLIGLVREDKGFARAFRSVSQVEELLEPYLLTRQKTVTREALEAAVKVIAQYTRLTGERSKWQSLWEKKSQATTRRPFVVAASKAPLDAYYGDMGGICLSLIPQAVLHPGFHVLRLFDATTRQIVGEAVLVLNKKPIASFDPTRPVWFLFAVNPLPSLLSQFGSEQQLELYFGFRDLAVQIARSTAFPLALPGYRTPGLLSNDGHLADLIRSWEVRRGARPVVDARGFELYYDEDSYARALVLDV